MKLIVFSGFLGAGKTVAILSLAAEILRNNQNKPNRLVILENEVGNVGIDDSLLAHAGLEVRSLLSGCICCTLSTDLTSEMNRIYERYNPEYVIFEPTGVAYPNRIIATLQQYAAGIEWIRQVTVVDAQRWERICSATPALARGQVADAAVVLLNKCDLVPEETASTVEAELREMNPAAVIYRTVVTDGLADEIWRRVLAHA